MESQFTHRTGRFAILTHDFPFFHWDLLLEAGDVAWTWRLTGTPGSELAAIDSGGSPLASEMVDQMIGQRIADHRLHYLDFEGPVSGNRGRVARVDEGHYRIVNETDSRLEVELAGRGELRQLRLPIRSESGTAVKPV